MSISSNVCVTKQSFYRAVIGISLYIQGLTIQVQVW